MRTIHKHELSTYQGHQIVTLHEGYELMCATVQRGKPVLYVLDDPDMPPIKTRILILQTGTHLNVDDLGMHQYIGTCVLMHGDYVLHYFEDSEV